MPHSNSAPARGISLRSICNSLSTCKLRPARIPAPQCTGSWHPAAAVTLAKKHASCGPCGPCGHRPSWLDILANVARALEVNEPAAQCEISPATSLFLSFCALSPPPLGRTSLSLSLSRSLSRSRSLSLSLHTLGPPEGSRPGGRESPMSVVCCCARGFRGWLDGPWAQLCLVPTLCPVEVRVETLGSTGARLGLCVNRLSRSLSRSLLLSFLPSFLSSFFLPFFFLAFFLCGMGTLCAEARRRCRVSRNYTARDVAGLQPPQSVPQRRPA